MLTRIACLTVTFAAVATTGVLGACGSGRNAKKPPVSTSATASIDHRAEAERGALAAYTGMWMAMAKAGETSNPDDPELRRYATGDALALVVGSLATDKQRGVVSKGRPVLNPRVTGATPGTAPTEVGIEDCGDSTNWLKYKANGEPADNTPGGKRRITATVTLTDGAWKVDSAKVGSLGSC